MLRLAKDLDIRQLLFRGDSQLVAKQMQKKFDYNNEKMIKYLAEVPKMEKFIDGFEVRYASRLDNRDTNHLTWIASSRASTSPDVIIERLSNPSIKPAEPSEEAIRHDLMVIDEPKQEPAYDWLRPIKMFLEK
jgi:hypothetical protein